jgi:hypothetical protein
MIKLQRVAKEAPAASFASAALFIGSRTGEGVRQLRVNSRLTRNFRLFPAAAA